LRVLDPACGSGAFLLGAMNRIAEARAVFEGRHPETLRREIVERSLYGVDLQADAALLCALRLWLSLLPTAPAPSPAVPSPLPNLDRNIRQGDALVDPIDLAAASLQSGDVSWSVARNAEVRAATRGLEPAAARYVTCEPVERAALQRELLQGEARLGRAWIEALQSALDHTERELRAASTDIDLFGHVTRRAQEAQRELAALTERKQKLAELRAALLEKKSLPFFSFDVHFAEACASGFDLIVSNPPWVRSHRWPESVGRVVRERYQVCRASPWQTSAAGRVPAAQVDLSLLFLERALRLLAPGGTLALLLPAKSFRSLYAGGARALVLRESRITYIEDHSLDQRSIFRADAFAGALVAARQEPDPAAPIRVSCYQRKAPPLQFEMPHHALSLIPDQPASPWLLVPPDVAAALRAMQACGAPIGARAELPIHRGVFTGANDVLLIDDVRVKLGDHAWIRAEGYAHTPAGKRRSSYRALMEESVLRPVVSGSGLRAWSHLSEQAIVWSHDANARAHDLPPRATRYLQRHAARLKQRSGWKAGQPLGAVFRVAPHTLLPKLAWRDLAPTLEAVVLPARTLQWGRQRELIPLNTVYYISPPTERCAQLLCAYFNSLPVRTFARALAERAKDAHFRFFAWVIAQTPLPASWERGSRSDQLCALAERALEQACIDPEQQAKLDELVAGAYALTAAQRAALLEYSAWLGAAHT
ncbi:MAG: Eco57I restriction-modification methylase domain-containing protein, partial [Longimicrobiales bacterium]